MFKSDLVSIYVKNPIDFILFQGLAPKPNNNLFYNPQNLNYISLNEAESEFYHIEIGSTYIVQVFIGSFAEGPLKNQEVSKPKLEFEEYPLIMTGLLGRAHRFVGIDHLSSFTDDQGMYYMELSIRQGGVGAYVAFFYFGSVSSIPMAFKTNNPIKSLKILSEPSFDKTSPDKDGAYYAGRVFDSPARVKIEVESGTPEDYLVLAQPLNLTDADL